MKKAVLHLLLYSCSLSSFAQTLQQPIDALIHNIDPNINMGMMVVDLNTGETLYQRHIKQTFIPASNMKLFSDATALLALGPDYHFQSQLSTDATHIQQGTLYGSLYLYLPGDPTLTKTDIDELFRVLPKLGVQRITGSVVLASDFAKVQPHPAGIVPRDLNYSYGASLAPLIVSENRVTITVNPSCRVGEPALVEYSAPTGSFVLDNQVTTVAGSAGGISFTTTDDNRLVVRGKIGQKQGSVQARIPVKNPLSHTQELIKLALQKQNITFNGTVTLGKIKPSMLLATHYSQPIVHIMAETLKPSDNLYADSLFLHTAAKIHGAPLNWEEAQPVIKQYLQQQTGIDMHPAVLIDGSGLSRHNLLTAEQTVELLSYLYNHFPLAYEYIAALPIAGQDGTLLHRLRNPTQKGLIRAKTGSMTGVISLSGYLYTANAHTLAFAIFINTRAGTHPNISGRYRSMVDSLCDYLLRQKPNTTQHLVLSPNPHASVAFQKQASDADKQRNRIVKWRRIEYALKQALKDQAVTVVFRDDQLILQDHNANINTVWSTLQKISHQYPIAIALEGAMEPTRMNPQPQLLWIKNQTLGTTRQWVLHERIS